LQTQTLERRLLLLAAGFVIAYSLALTLSPAARLHAWNVPLRWDHWLGVAVWLGMFTLAHVQSDRWLPGRDPLLLPVIAALSGWGLLSVWRLLPEFGARQGAWLALSAGVLIAGLRLPGDLNLLRRYKYIWLTSALLLTAATLLFGVNPLGYGPPMWLGCCGIYLQPSEPLKLLLIAYLAASMADLQPFFLLASGMSPSIKRGAGRSQWRATPISLLAPTLLMVSLAMGILIIQRDLGTTAIFLFLYAVVVYLASGSLAVLAAAGISAALAGALGYTLFDVVRVRVDAWINPWLDPAGRSYQIIQSMIAVANGGWLGRGPGLGSPGLVPLSHSDLVFSSIAEETGLVGVIALLLLLGLLAVRGLRAALLAYSSYHRYLAAGLTALLAGQSLLIISGSLRLLPLTGVTLPFVSYGGSSLLTCFICALLLLHISNAGEDSPARLAGFPARLYRPGAFLGMGAVLLAGLAACGLAAGWWVFVRGDALLSRTDNQRRYIADRFVLRGAILDRDNQPIVRSTGSPGEYIRRVAYTDLSNLVGYTNAAFGQAGLEAGLDEYLRGLLSAPPIEVWWNRVLYSQPPPGQDVRLTLDLDLQHRGDTALADRRAALVAINARSGEILAIASSPTYDANRLEEHHEALLNDPGAPLFNRAVQGRYPLGDLARLFPAETSGLWVDASSALHLPAVQVAVANGQAYSPVQVAVAASALSSGGVRPAPQLVAAVRHPSTGWMPLQPALVAQSVLTAEQVSQSVSGYSVRTNTLSHTWLAAAVVPAPGGQSATWAVAGTQPDWNGNPYVVVVYLEDQADKSIASQIAVDFLGLLLK